MIVINILSILYKHVNSLSYTIYNLCYILILVNIILYNIQPIRRNMNKSNCPRLDMTMLFQLSGNMYIYIIDRNALLSLYIRISNFRNVYSKNDIYGCQ